MIELHPEFLSKNGKKEFAVLTYEEFLKIQEILENLEDLEDLRKAKEEEKDVPTYSLDEVKKMQQKASSDWQIAINKISKQDKTKQQEKMKQIFESWDKWDDEQEQKETLSIIQSLETVSI